MNKINNQLKREIMLISAFILLICSQS
jgi:hypothetical protein